MTDKRELINRICIIICLIWGAIFETEAATNTVQKYINEESSAGTEVADLPQTFGLLWQERQSRRYKLLSQKLITRKPASSSSDKEWVELNGKSGVITLTNRIDREEMCGYAEECVIQIQVVMLPQQYFTLLNIDLDVIDINDHFPKFSSEKSSVNISEEVEVNDVINIDFLQAQDLDIGENGEISYKLSSNNYFQVDQSKDEAGTSHLQLIIKTKLDYEDKKVHKLKLTATDGGSPSRSNELDIIINIMDENDNSPVFEKQEYVASVKESEQQGTVIATVHANDMDYSLFGEVRYYLPEPSVNDKTADLARQLVKIDEISGEVILKQKLSKETNDGLRVLIEARDLAETKPRIGKTWLILRVEDVNDNDPSISVNFIMDSANDTVYVPESESRGVYIAYVSATDADNGRNGDVTVSIRTTSVNGKRMESSFDIEEPYFVLEGDGLLGIGKNLDREVNNQYTVAITACDNGQPPRCSNKVIKIVVTDVNDFKPEFKTNKQSINILENSPIGTKVATLVAEDRDAINPPGIILNKAGLPMPSEYGHVRYSIVKGDKRQFQIEADSGKVTLLKTLDYENVNKWELVINAKDGGEKKSKSSNCTLMIQVIDINDNPPIFVNPVRNNTKVYATVLKDQLIMKVKAKDSDKGENSKLVYKIVEEDGVKLNRIKPQQTIFLIHPSSGDLRLNFSNPNITDMLGVHSLLIEVTDGGEFPLKKAATLLVEVIDEEVATPMLGETMDIKVIIMIGVIGTVLLALIIIVIFAMVKCQKRNKQARTYNCRNAESKSKDAWITKMDGLNPYDISTPYSVKKNFDIEISLQSPSRSSIMKKPETLNNNRNEYASMMYTSETERSYPNPETSADNGNAALTTFTNDPKGTNPSLLQPNVTPSTVDRDSGRGDSDPEMTTNEVIEADENKTNQSGSVSSEMGPRCNETCLHDGHSDTCWMPSPTRETNAYIPQPLSYSRTSIATPSSRPSYLETYNESYMPYHPYVDNQPRYPEYHDEIPDYPPPPPVSDGMYQSTQEVYPHGYGNDLGTISENGDPTSYPREQFGNFIMDEDADDVSVHTQLALSTDVNSTALYNGSQNRLNVMPLSNSRTNSLRRNDNFQEPPHVQRTVPTSEYQVNHKPVPYMRATSRLSSCSSNASSSYRPRNTPHRNNPYNKPNISQGPYVQTNFINGNSNSNNNLSSTADYHDRMSLLHNQYSSNDRLTPVPKLAPLDEYYQNKTRPNDVNISGNVTMEETKDILKSIEQLIES